MDAQPTSAVLAEAHKRGPVLIKAGMYDNVLRILAPLCITDAQLRQGLDIVEEALGVVTDTITANPAHEESIKQ